MSKALDRRLKAVEKNKAEAQATASAFDRAVFRLLTNEELHAIITAAERANDDQMLFNDAEWRAENLTEVEAAAINRVAGLMAMSIEELSAL